MKTRRVFLFALLSGLILTPRPGAAETNGAAGAPTVLDVMVTDKAERPVAGLKAEDFKVVDNKQQRNVIGVREVAGETGDADPPVEAILLVDQINVTSETMARERKGIEDLPATER